MRNKIALFTLFLAVSALCQAQELTQLYSSGTNPDQSLDLLINSAEAGTFYYLDSGNILQNTATEIYLDQTGWQMGTLNSPAHPYVGYRHAGTNPIVAPIFFPESTGVPAHASFALLESDAQGDQAVGSSYLDILETKVAFSENKLYYTIRNNSTQFPTSSGVTFFSYMGVLVDPAAEATPDQIVYGLMYTVDIQGVMSPALYKITGTGLDGLTQIGEIEATIDAGTSTLTLSCDLADLLADADFNAWFDPAYPLVATQAITSRISLTTGIVTSDTTPGCNILLLPLEYDTANAEEPQLASPATSWTEGYLSLEVYYADVDANIAQEMQFSIDGGESHPLYPVDFSGFDQPVLFTAEAVPCPVNWQQLTISVVNAGQLYTMSLLNSVSTDDLVQAPAAIILYPNPVKSTLSYRLSSQNPSGVIRIYNLRGQQVAQQKASERSSAIDVVELPAGTYFLKYGSAIRAFRKF